jgi:XTP/dITP diphosphohydrolase
MRKLLIATNNPGKMLEFHELLGSLPLELITPASIGLTLDVPELGSTYAENAITKAETFANAAGIPALADDTGLEVDALDGAPGLHSRRFIPREDATDAQRRAYLISLLQDRPRPWSARFRCVVAVAQPGLPTQTVEGICPGEIIPQERGENGFGYDPVFLLAEIGKTMAELVMQEKNTLSHRARAVLKAHPILAKLDG